MSKDFKGIEGVEAVSSDKHLANFSDEKNCKSGEYNTSILGGSFNLVNTIIGSGIIGLPFAISSCGFGLGIFLLTFVAWLIYWSCVLLVKCGLKTGHLDFEELAEHSFGLLGYILVSLFMLIFCFGAMVAYFVVIGDSIPPVVQLYHPDLEITSRPILIVLFGVILVLPLCLLKDLTSLAKTSAVSITCDILIIFIVLIVGPGQAKDQGIVLTQQSLGGVGSTVFSGVGIFSFAFVCQQSNFFIFKGLKDRSIEAWKKTAGISIGISYILTFVFGVGGYLIFLDNSFGNVLNNFNFTAEPIICARLLLAITMIFTLPMECYVGRHAVVSVILRLISEFNKWNSKEGDDTRQSHMPSTKEEGRDTWLYTSLRVFVTVIIWGSTMAVGIVVLDLGIVLALTGTIAASFLAFIFPSCIYFKTFHREILEDIFELVYNQNISKCEYGSMKTSLDVEPPKDVEVPPNNVEVPPNDVEVPPYTDGTCVSTRTMVEKIGVFQDHFIATIMGMFGVIALVAGLQSIFSSE